VTSFHRPSITPIGVAVAAALALVAGACAGPADDGGLSDDDADGEAPVGSEQESELEDGTDDTDGTEDVDGADDADEEAAPELAVVATVAPVADLVEQVGGDRVDVTSMVPAGADAHTYEPRPQDVVVLSEADAYVGIGLGLNDGALRMAEENLPGGSPLVRLGELALEDDDLVFDHDHGHGHDEGDDHGHGHDEGDGHGHGHDEGDGHGHGHDEGDGHGHDHDEGDGHGHDHDDGDGLGPNPHVWTSLRNAARLVDGIEETLVELDPDGEAAYTANAEEYRRQLEELDGAIGEATATIPAEDRTLVTYHDAWTYFAEDHGLEYATAVQPADFSDPSAAEVRELIELVEELDVPVLFGAEEFPTPVLEAIAEETGAGYVDDLADDVLPGEPGDPEHTYLELMRRNAVTIVEGLGGDAGQL
jgi:ABC-type Zn uptake system ZnuABC Zn-binding protein ZnuA